MKKKKVLVILIVVLMFMGLGYTVLSQRLQIRGISNTTGKFEVYIDKVELNEEETKTSNANIELMEKEENAGTTSKTEGYFNAILESPGDYATFKVVIKNEGTIDAILYTVLREPEPDREFKEYLERRGERYSKYFSMSNPFVEGEILRVGEEKEYEITVRYKEEVTDIPEGKLTVGIELNYRQLAKTEMPGSTTPTPDIPSYDYIVDERGIITAYNPRVTTEDGWIVIPGENKEGEEIRGISEESFKDYNVLNYYWIDELSGEEENVLVVYDEDNYEGIKVILDQQITRTIGEGQGKIKKLNSEVKKISGWNKKTKIIRLSEYTGLNTNEYEKVNKRYLKIDVGNRTIENAGYTVKKIDLRNAVNLTEIKEESFKGATLEEIKLGNKIEIIGKNAFIDNNIRGRLEIPSSVKNIGENAFKGNQITEVKLGSGLREAGSNVFSENQIQKVELESGLERIPEGMFKNQQIKDIELPESLRVIGEEAFKGNDIKDITIPYNVSVIGDNAFKDNSFEYSVDIIIESNSNNSNTRFNNRWGIIGFPEEGPYEGQYGCFYINEDAPSEILGYEGICYDRLYYAYEQQEEERYEADENYEGEEFKFELEIPDKINRVDIKSIGDYLFSGFGITSLKLPSKLERIGAYSFESNMLSEINIPNTVKRIEYGAFSGNQITSVIIPASVTTIGENAFENNQLTNVIIPASVTTIGDYAFYNNNFSNSSDITIEYNEQNLVTRFDDAWETIGFPSDKYDCFYLKRGNNSVITDYDNTCSKDVVIPKQINGKTITAIGRSAFYNKRITSVTFEDTEENPNQLTTIGDYAFTSNQLTSVTIPSSVTTIGNRAFVGNNFSNEDDITIGYNDQNSITRFNSRWAAIGFPGNGPTTINAGCFRINVNNIHEIAGYDNTCSKDVVIPRMINKNIITTIGEYAFYNNQLTSVTIPSSVTTIGNSAFYNNQLTSVAFEDTGEHPSQLTTIGVAAFGHNQLTSVTIPSSVTTIERHAFYDNQLTSIIFEDTQEHPSNLTSIGASAFENNQLTNITIPASVTTIETSAFENNQLTSVIIPSSVTKIESYAFYNNNFDNSSNVTIEYNEQNPKTRFNSRWYDIGFPSDKYGCFYLNHTDNSILTNYDNTCSKDVVIPSEINGTAITRIGRNAFKSKNLTSVFIPYTITTIGGGYTYTWSSSSSSMVYVYYGAFSNNQLTNVTLEDTEEHPSRLTTIEDYAFYNNQLTSITIPSSVTTIGESAFYNNQLISVTFVDDEEHSSCLTTIGESAFNSNQLTSVEIPSSITTIGLGAFKNNYLSSITIRYNEQNPITRFDSRWYSIGFPHDKYGCFYLNHTDNSNLTNYDNTCSKDVVIPSEINKTAITRIGSNAFYGNELTSVIIPDSVTTIGENAFAYNQLTSVIIPNSVATIGNRAFESNPNLSTIVVKRANSDGMSLGTYWNGSANVIFDPNYEE